jgi:septum formation protein
MAASKGAMVARDHNSAWVLAADTTVVLEGRILGKPESAEQALETLLLLSGQEHVVTTAFCLLNRQSGVRHLDKVNTRVRFAPFDRELAAAYVRTGEPMDKAGAYGIQGLGGMLVDSLHGSYSNVIGLPLAEVVSALRKNDVITIS